MRDGWRETTLGEVATRRKDFTPVVADALYRVVGVQRSGWGLVDRPPVRGDSMKFDKLLELHTDDLVYRTITAFEAPSAVVLSEFDGAFVTPQTFPTYAIDRDQLLPGYIALLTTAPEFHEAMSTRCVGSVLRRKTLSPSAFESIPIALPPLGEQRRIVDLIAAVDEAIEAAAGEASRSERVCGITCDAIAAATDATERKVAELVAIAKSGGTPSRANPAYYGGAIPWLKSGEVRGRGITTTSEAITEEALSGSSAWLAPAGSVLVAMYGGGTVGQVGQLAAPMATNQAVLALVANPAVIAPRMLYHLLSADSDRLAAMAVGAAQANISKKVVLAHAIHVPSVNRQHELVDALDALLDAADAARDTADALRTLRSNLLTVLLSGEHEIPSSYDALLEEVA